jgi:hypothetical protein
MFTFREKWSQVPPVPEDYNVTAPPTPHPREMPLHLLLLLYIIKALEVEGASLSPSEHPAYLPPALCMFGLLSVVFFGTSHHPQLGV